MTYLHYLLERLENCLKHLFKTEAYDILVNKLERQEKRIVKIKKQNGIF